MTITGPQPAIRIPPDPVVPDSVAAMPRIIRSRDLPPGCPVVWSDDGKFIVVRASLSHRERRDAIRRALAQVRRVPNLAYALAVSYTALRPAGKPRRRRGTRGREGGRHGRS